MLKLRLIAIAITAIVIGFCGWKYHQKSSEALELKARLVQQEAVVAELTRVSAANAAAALKADEDRRKAVDQLENAQAELAQSTDQARAADADIDASAPEDDGPVAPVLQRLRAGRFGGAK